MSWSGSKLHENNRLAWLFVAACRACMPGQVTSRPVAFSTEKGVIWRKILKIQKMMAGKGDLPSPRNMVAIYYAYYNFCRGSPTLKVTPTMEAGLTDHVPNRNCWRMPVPLSKNEQAVCSVGYNFSPHERPVRAVESGIAQ